MENNSIGRWTIRAAIVGVFLLGCLTGALGLNAYRSHLWRFSRDQRFEQMLNRLHLTSDQRTQVEQIMEESRSKLIEIRRQAEPQYKEVRKQTDEKMQTVLSPEQMQGWRQMTQEIRERRRWNRAPQ